jgi:1,4-dihydroxy-2-naphthoate octaprenyltransferase
MAQTGSLNLGAALYAIPLAMNTEAIFHCNNTRNMESDRSAGAVTLAILIGPQLSHMLYVILLFVPYLFFIYVAVHYSMVFLIPLVTIPKAFHLEKEFRSRNMSRDLPRKTARLNLYFGIFYFMACCLTDASKLPLLTRVRLF